MSPYSRFIHTIVILVLLAASLAIMPQSSSAAAAVTLNPSSGPAGSVVTGNGTGWTAGHQISVQWGQGQVLAAGTVGAYGAFSIAFTIPTSAAAGANTVYFVDGGFFIPVTFTVGPTSSGSGPTINLNRNSGATDSQVTISGAGWRAGHIVDVQWQSGLLLGTFQVAGNGMFSGAITIPAPASIGFHAVYAVDQSVVYGATAATGFTVNSAAYYSGPWVELSPSIGPRGTTVTVTGGGWTPGGRIEVSGSECDPACENLTALVNGDGRFTLSFGILARAGGEEWARRWDWAVGVAGGGSFVFVGFIITDATNTPPPSQPPSGVPTPFLDLPFAITSSTVRNRAHSNWSEPDGWIESWFDHQYPLYHLGGRENHLVRYDGIDHTPTSPNGSAAIRCADNFCYEGHDGIDFAPKAGGYTAIHPAANGTVASVKSDCLDIRTQKNGCGAYGNHVILNHQNGYFTLYGHLAVGSVSLTTGTQLTTGDVLGMMGNTGNSVGIHLHFGVYRDDGNGVWDGATKDMPVDPYGWSPADNRPDPWVREGGPVSYPLWRESTVPLSAIPLTVNQPAPSQGNVTFVRIGGQVTLTANPSSGQIFAGWQVGGSGIASLALPAVDSWANPLTLNLAQATTVTPVFVAQAGFGDVAYFDPAARPIAELAARGIIRGCDPVAGLFCPSDPTLRAQMAALIARAMGWDSEDWGNGFPDRGPVDADLWRNVGTLAHYDVARGYPDGRGGFYYDPTNNVLNAQVISFITRAMVRKGYWQQRGADPNLYGGVLNGTGHEADVATYVHYAGALPDFPASGPFGAWDQPSTRNWFARTLWQALDSHFGVSLVTPAPTPTPPPSPPEPYQQPLPDPNPPPIVTLVGAWMNVNPNTQSIPRIDVARDGGDLLFHAYGSCSPSYCDWGTVRVRYEGTPITVVYDFGFLTDTLTISLVDGRLIAEGWTHFADGSGRPDYASRDEFTIQ